MLRWKGDRGGYIIIKGNKKDNWCVRAGGEAENDRCERSRKTEKIINRANNKKNGNLGENERTRNLSRGCFDRLGEIAALRTDTAGKTIRQRDPRAGRAGHGRTRKAFKIALDTFGVESVSK